ncbi:hypothetical protein BDY19DRAFT_712164 [Irpex rosettiformis]|uniref:Uncharacterized protein n=1 Tax=Irpex rosettiformis TaxID=378272 RepID=A0ACB8U8J8_9APHY|nr:hypothetical protein BDY19DRAFT_712164 [Irpex rosettiformis]
MRHLDADHGQRVKTRRRSTSDASIAPSHPLAFNGLVPPLPGSIQTTTHEDTRERNNTRRRSASDASMAPLRPPFSPPSPQNPVPASPAELARHTKHESVKDQLGDLPNLSWTRHGNPSSTPQFFRIHTRLPPLSAIRAHCFSNPYEPLNAGAFKFGSPLIGGSDVDPAPPCSVFTEARRQDEVGEDRGGQGIVSLGLGIEFYEDELNSRCPSPYMNPRPAPAPPLVLEPRGVEVERRGKADAEVDIDDEELKVPDYVFERRGSATSQATTSSGRSTKTLKERLTSFVTLSTKPYTSSVWSLKQPSHSRSKLNLTLVAPSPSPLNQPVTSSSTSTTTPGLVHPKADASPHAKSTRSYKSNSTVLTQSTSESSEFLNTPRTPASGLYRYPPSTPPVRSFAGHGLSSSPPSAFNTGMSSGSPSRSSKLMKRSSYTSRLYPMQSKLGSRSELSLALGMGMGLGAGTGARDSMGCFDGGEVDKETEEEARAIGRVLTPEVDPFMRMPMGATAYMPERRSVRGGSAGGSVVAESEESLVASEETFVSADENCGMDELGGGTSEGGHALTSSRDSVAPAVGNLNSVARMRARERGIESRLTFGSSLEGCSSPPPRYSRLSPGPSAYTHTLPQILHSTFSSESSSSLSLVIPEDSTCGIPDSPVLPSASPLPSPSTPRLSYSSPPLSASELPPTPTLTQSTSPLAPSPPPILSPLSPMSTLSFTFLQDL